MGLVASVLLLAGASAKADETFTGTSGADTYVMGVHSGAIKVCLVGSGTLTEVDADLTLSENVTFNAGAGADTIKILGSGDSSENVCDVTLASGFSDGGFEVNVNGGDDNDTLRGGVGVEGDLHGDGGNDLIRLRDTYAVFGDQSTAFGDLGDDHLCATDVSSGNMRLDGADGADIFEVSATSSGTITYFLGASDGDADVYENDTSFTEDVQQSGAGDSGVADPSSNCLTI
jgi:hypothetical protein